MSTSFQSSSLLVDNNIGGSSARTQQEANPWMNVKLSESGTIRTVVIIANPVIVSNLAQTSIRIGDDPNPNNNPECFGNIEKDGVYECTTPMTGTYIGFVRAGTSTGSYSFREIWAFAWVPFDETNTTLTADQISNPSLVNAVHLKSSPLNNIGITSNSLFTTGPAVNSYWMMQLSATMHVKSVLIIGDWNTKITTLRDWKVTVGDNPDPLLNPVILISSSGGREVNVNAWGMYVAIIRTTDTDTLILGYVGVFATAYDCSLTNTVTVPSLPETIDAGSTHTYTVANSLNAACISKVTVVEQNTNGLPSFMSFNPTTNSFVAAPGLTQLGTFTIEFTVKTVFDGMSPSQTTTIAKVITVQACQVASFTAAGTIPNQDYVLGFTKILIPIPSLTQTPACGDVITYSLNTIPSFVNIEGTNVALFGTDLTQTETINAIVTARASVSGASFQFPFQIVAHNCKPLNFIASPNPLEISQLAPVTTITLSMSPLHANCGLFTYSLVSNQLPTSTSLASNVISVSTDLNINAGTYSVQTRVQMQNSPFLSTDLLVTINVSACKVASFTAAATIPNQIYVLGSTKILIPIPSLTQTPACGDAIAYMLNTIPSFVQIEGANVALFGSDLNQAGTINAIVTVRASVSVATFQFPFQIFAYNCTPLNLIASPNPLAISQLAPATKITLSMDMLNANCGLFTYSLVSNQLPISVSLASNVISVFADLNISTGAYLIKTRVQMQNSPFLSTDLLVTINVSLCQILKIKPDTTLPAAIDFFVGGPAKLFELPKFSQEPNCQFQRLYSDSAKNYDDAMVIYELQLNKLKVQPNYPSQAKTFTLKSTATFAEMPSISDTQTSNLNVINAQCLTMNDVSYNIKATATPIASSWVLDNQGALVTSSNFSFSQVKIAVIYDSQSSLPSWFSWNATTRTFSIVSNNNADAGSYSFKFKLTSALHEGWSCVIKMTAVLQFDATVSAIPSLNKIQFMTPLVTAFNVDSVSEWRYSLPKPTYLVLNKDVNEQDISISVTAPAFILYSNSQNQLFTTRALTENDKGTISINISLYDTKGMSSKYTITIQVGIPDIVPSQPPIISTEATITPQSQVQNPNQTPIVQPEQNTSQPVQNPEQAARVEEAKQLANQAVQTLNAQVNSVSTWDGWKILLKSLDTQTKSEKKLEMANQKQSEMSIQSISNLGIIQIKFSQPIKVPSSFKRRTRLLGSIEDAIQIRLQSDSQVDIHFSWNITEFKENGMEIHLNFTNAASVSSTSSDVLIIQVVDPSYFIDYDGNMLDSFIIATQIPRQIQMGSIDEAVTNLAESAGNGAKGFVITNFFVSLMLSASLNQMWSMVEAQQIIVMLPLFNIQIPATPAVVIGKFLEIANFDVIPMQNIWSKVFYMPPCQTLSQRFVAIGIQDSQFVSNLGSMFFSILLVQVLIIIAYLIQLLKKTKSSRVKSLWIKIEPLAFWNFPTQTLMETFMMIALCSMLTIKYPNWQSRGQKIDTILAYFFGSLITIFLLVSTIIMVVESRRLQKIDQKEEELKDRKEISDIQKKLKPLFEELDLFNPWIPFFRFVFLFRRLVLAVAVVLVDKLIFQLFLGYFQSLLMIITIGMANPYQEYSKHRKELINEAVILSTLYFVMCFSDLVPDRFAQNIVGYTFCGMISLHIVVNIMLIVITSIISYVNRFRQYLFIRKAKKMAQQTRSLIDREKLKRHILELGANRNKAFENSLENSLTEIEQAIIAQYMKETKSQVQTKINHKLLRKITRTVTKMGKELDVIEEESADCIAQVDEEEAEQESHAQDNSEVNDELNHIQINRSFLEDDSDLEAQNDSATVISSVAKEENDIVKLDIEDYEAMRDISVVQVAEQNSEVNEEVIIPGCKKINTLEPEPEEEIIDTSSKPKPVFYDEDYGSEEYIDTWDLEDPEELEHSNGFDHIQNDQQRNLFMLDQQFPTEDDDTIMRQDNLPSFNLVQIANEITDSKATQMNFPEIPREQLQQKMDELPQANDNTPPKKQSWGLVTQAALNLSRKRQVITRKFWK